ncbi:hypothetical protein DITRI_Ditri07aG0161500 [Diplodiscus trichospermus]
MSDFIPQEIILQILYCLPVKSLVKFTLVYKSWQSLIISSCFINTHLAKSLSKPPCSQRLLIRNFTDSPKKERYFLHLNNESIDIHQTLKSPLKPRKNLYSRIVGTVHGLICLSDDLFGKSIELPRPNVTFEEVGPYMFTLGFGSDAKKNDYKVVRLVYAEGDPGDTSFDHLTPKVECFLNGMVHWITFEKKVASFKNLVLLFDMEDEKFRKMKLPDSLVDVNPMKLFISLTRGMLTMFEYYIAEAE